MYKPGPYNQRFIASPRSRRDAAAIAGQEKPAKQTGEGAAEETRRPNTQSASRHRGLRRSN